MSLKGSMEGRSRTLGGQLITQISQLCKVGVSSFGCSQVSWSNSGLCFVLEWGRLGEGSRREVVCLFVCLVILELGLLCSGLAVSFCCHISSAVGSESVWGTFQGFLLS